MQQKDDEIDIKFIFTKAGDAFTAFWNFLLHSFSVAQKRWVLILFFCLSGVGMGVGFFFNSSPVYNSTLILSSNVLSNDFCADIINTLDLIISDKTPALLARKLKISISSAKAIKKLEFDNYDEKLKTIYKDKDTIVLGRPFRVIASTYNNTVFDTLQKALVSYLENNEYALKRKAIKSDNLNLMQSKIKNQLDQLDSLKSVVTSNLTPRGTQSGFVFGQPIDPINVYKQEIELFKSDLDLKKDLILIDNIQVIQDFVARDKPDSPRLLKNIAIFGMLAFLLGLIFALSLEKRKKQS